MSLSVMYDYVRYVYGIYVNYKINHRHLSSQILLRFETQNKNHLYVNPPFIFKPVPYTIAIEFTYGIWQMGLLNNS